MVITSGLNNKSSHLSPGRTKLLIESYTLLASASRTWLGERGNLLESITKYFENYNNKTCNDVIMCYHTKRNRDIVGYIYPEYICPLEPVFNMVPQ